MLPVHHVYPRFLGRIAVLVRCAGTPAPLGRVKDPTSDGLVPRAARGRLSVFRRRRRVAALVVALLGCAACARADAAADPADESVRFEGSVGSLDLLGEHVLTALTRSDTAALERVRLTEHEHNDIVWPELPASAPEVNFPLDYAWTNIENRNVRALSRILPLYRDRALRFERVECRGDTEAFATFVVHTDCCVVFTLAGSDEHYEAQIFKDVLVRAGGHKIFRYYDEEPRRLRSASGG